MADQIKPSELALATFHETTKFLDSDIVDSDTETYSPKIDSSLLLDPNKVIIGEVISEGVYSVVYSGWYESMPVAIKWFQEDSSTPTLHTGGIELHERFSQEVSMISRVKHDNIVKFVGAVEVPAMLIITELMNGGTLETFLCGLRPNRLDLKLSISYALDISHAMQYLHQNRIIHRDLKPSNILLTEDNKIIKLADFGIAREESDGNMTAEAGTYRWMAPEMICITEEPLRREARKHYDHKVDVYSFSLVLWELLTNNMPFSDRNNMLAAYDALQNRRPSVDEIPEQIAPLLQSCWDAKPNDRPEFDQITEILQNFLHSISQSEISSPKSQPSLSEKEVEVSMRKDDNEDVPATNRLMDRSEGSTKKPKSLCSRFLCCL